MHTPLRYLMCSVHGLHVFSAELRIPTILVKRANVWAMRYGVFHGICESRFVGGGGGGGCTHT